MPNRHLKFTDTMRKAAVYSALIISLSLTLRLILDIAESIQSGNGILFGILKFATAFTHLTNVLIGTILFSHAGGSAHRISRFFAKPWVVGCAACYITVMALTWKVMLAPSVTEGLHILMESFEPGRLVGVFLHGINPAMFLCFWLFFVPKKQLHWRQPFLWPIGAMLYFIGILIRGAIQGIYPYPFVDVVALGYTTVFTNAIYLLCFFVAVGLAFVAIDKWDPIGYFKKS